MNNGYVAIRSVTYIETNHAPKMRWSQPRFNYKPHDDCTDGVTDARVVQHIGLLHPIADNDAL